MVSSMGALAPLIKGVATMACQNRQQTLFSLGFGKNMGKWRVVGGKWEFQPLALDKKVNVEPCNGNM